MREGKWEEGDEFVGKLRVYVPVYLSAYINILRLKWKRSEFLCRIKRYRIRKETAMKNINK